ncbi:sterol desaturase family protein [Albidovulum sp.]
MLPSPPPPNQQPTFLFGRKAELGKHAAQNSSATIVICLANVGVGLLFLDELNGALQSAYDAIGIPTIPADSWDGMPLWAVCLIGIAAKDLVDYWNHRLMHTRWVWPAHAAHHSDTHVNAFTAYRVHFLETLIMTLSYILLLSWLQMPQAIPAVAVLAILHNQYVHMDLDFDHGPLRFVIASPVFHRWHHADLPEAHGKNLANVMPLYDLIFGTYYNPGPCRAAMGARSSGIEDKDPVAIFLHPFRDWAGLVRRALARRGGEPRRAPRSGTAPRIRAR